jgi:hypothetical protein
MADTGVVILARQGEALGQLRQLTVKSGIETGDLR